MGAGDDTVKLTFEVEVETEHSRREVIEWIDTEALARISAAIGIVLGGVEVRVRLQRRPH